MGKYVLIAVALMCLQIPASRATLYEGFDFSNVDLVNFEYFKNLASQDPRTGAQANPILVHFQKKKAVLDYIERLFLGNSPFQQPSEIPFDPHFGRAWRPTYERKFGRRGERLIAALGSGYSLKQLRHFGAIPYEYGTSYYRS
ncbi:uncharacterized protein LOC132791849 [Drosophila nasuta]|uniref:Uncharacterized protein LOC117567165 n=1 Tax=Drosophila albomicans TaxID=7291 RepID=A0A6P8WIE1_DROAB|nr:uncharacterized protein LOC117567165 [Drosophila albomicans]XP_060656928.1 uncharacterized protein LOC132791849 [Drosophila nasuta]